MDSWWTGFALTEWTCFRERLPEDHRLRVCWVTIVRSRSDFSRRHQSDLEYIYCSM